MQFVVVLVRLDRKLCSVMRVTGFLHKWPGCDLTAERVQKKRCIARYAEFGRIMGCKLGLL